MTEQRDLCRCGHDEDLHQGFVCLAKVAEGSVCPCSAFDRRPHLTLVPPTATVYEFGCLSPEERGAEGAA